MSDDRGVWLYAVARRITPETLTWLSGVGGEAVRAVQSAGLFAAISPVGLGEFGTEPLRRNLEDLDWLAAVARAHDAVVEAVARAAATVPMRLATVYLDEQRVRGMLADRRAELTAALDRLDGRTEWGVKGYAEPATAERTPEPATSAPAGGGTGTAYLQRRKAQLSARATAEREAAEQAQAVHRDLAALAAAARLHPPQDQRLSGNKASMILNGAYLVDDARGEAFAARVVALDAQLPAVRLELTGPWPPYSFAGVEEPVR